MMITLIILADYDCGNLSAYHFLGREPPRVPVAAGPFSCGQVESGSESPHSDESDSPSSSPYRRPGNAGLEDVRGPGH
jgi:hypothetical protein